MHHSRIVALLSFVAMLAAAPLLAQEPSGNTPPLEVGLDAAVAAPDVISERSRRSWRRA